MLLYTQKCYGAFYSFSIFLGGTPIEPRPGIDNERPQLRLISSMRLVIIDRTRFEVNKSRHGQSPKQKGLPAIESNLLLLTRLLFSRRP